DTDDFGIPLGVEIISINGESSQAIIQKSLKYAPSDGYTLTKKYRQIEKEFGILHYYEYGIKENYAVKYASNNGEVKTIEIAPQSFESIGKRYPNRNSHFALYHNTTDRIGYFKSRIAEKWPFVYYLDSISTAVLVANSF